MEQLPTRAYSRSGFCTGQPGISTLKCVNFKTEHWNAIGATFRHGPRTAPTWDKPLIDKENRRKSGSTDTCRKHHLAAGTPLRHRAALSRQVSAFTNNGFTP
jgi:hypothetical protein